MMDELIFNVNELKALVEQVVKGRPAHNNFGVHYHINCHNCQTWSEEIYKYDQSLLDLDRYMQVHGREICNQLAGQLLPLLPDRTHDKLHKLALEAEERAVNAEKEVLHWKEKVVWWADNRQSWVDSHEALEKDFEKAIGISWELHNASMPRNMGGTNWPREKWIEEVKAILCPAKKDENET